MRGLIEVALLALCANVANAVSPLIIQGANFVNSVSGARFQIVGVAYQPGGSSGYNPGSGVDPLSDGPICLRDAALMQRLGVNAIRVYNVDPDINHDLCASIFSTAGIYLMIDVNSPLPNESIDRSQPWTSYNPVYLNRTFAVVEAFKGYTNTMLFFSGNEVINDIPTASTAPYIRAVTRDLKQYVAKHSKRPIPVGYSAADVREVLVDSWNYFQCSTTGDTSDMSRADVFALNSYSWCGPASFQTAGYDVLTSYFTNTSVPVFFSEYGCREIRPRVFTEVGALYGPRMTPYLSGGVVYEYTQEENDYGLVNLSSSDGSAQLRTDYDNLQKQYNLLNLTLLQSSTPGNTTNQPPACKAGLISNSGFPTNFTLPIQLPTIAALISSGLKNANQGKLITVSDLNVKQPIKDSAGNAITGLAVKALADDQSNNPTGVTAPSGAASSSTTAAPAATSSKGAAGTINVSSLSPVAGVLAALWWM